MKCAPLSMLHAVVLKTVVNRRYAAVCGFNTGRERERDERDVWLSELRPREGHLYLERWTYTFPDL